MVFRYIRQLARFLRRQRIEIVHTNSLKADVIGGLAGRLAHIPVIWHVRDRIEDDYLPGPVVHVFRILCRIVPQYVVANSAATLATVHLSAARPGAVIPSGVEIPEDFQKDLQRTDAKIETMPGVVPGRPDAFPGHWLVGRLSRWKGQHIFLQAAAQVQARHPHARFHLIGGALFGEAAYEQELHTLVTTYGLEKSVKFWGFRSNVADLIGGLDHCGACVHNRRAIRSGRDRRDAGR